MLFEVQAKQQVHLAAPQIVLVWLVMVCVERSVALDVPAQVHKSMGRSVVHLWLAKCSLWWILPI